jgi:RND family efflux transporter MFP subunit
MDDLTQNWLTLQCKMISGVMRAIVLLRAGEANALQPVAFYPERLDDAGELQTAAQRAMASRRGTIQPPSAGTAPGEPAVEYAALPIFLNEQLVGAISLEVTRRPAAQQQAMLQVLQWGIAWLEVLHKQQAEYNNNRLVTVLDLMAAALERDNVHATATAVVTELASRLGSDRVSLGLIKGERLEVVALSHSARFDPRANLMREIEAAMQEAIDQLASVIYPPPPSSELLVTRAHSLLAESQGSGGVCTVPLLADGEPVGAIMLERKDSAFEEPVRELCEHTALLLGPVMRAKLNNERPLPRLLLDASRERLGKIMGPRYVLRKLLIGAALLALVAVTFIPGEYRVTADARLLGIVQRVVVAPQDGYIAEASLRAGDRVQEGDVLATLDDKDLKLERLKWAGKREQYRKEYRSALAEYDRATVAVLSAQIEQAEAQIQLLDEQLARTRLLAPFSGIVVSGDLSQSLGAPVERGDVLFEVAPEGDYRVMLDVDERDVAQLEVGQHGVLALSSLPDLRLPLSITRITPVSEVRDGKNVFQVEASLDKEYPHLRPGMNGVGKIDIGRRSLLWIWMHDVVDWVRLTLWSWWP